MLRILSVVGSGITIVGSDITIIGSNIVSLAQNRTPADRIRNIGRFKTRSCDLNAAYVIGQLVTCDNCRPYVSY